MRPSGWQVVATRVVSKALRRHLFRLFLKYLARMPDAQSINGIAPIRSEYRLFERMMNRIQRNMETKNSRAMIIADQGKSYDALLRKMRRHNFIPSRFGRWQDGSAARNIPTNRIIEDIVYRDSQNSLLVQAADACAFALLRREKPTATLTAANLHTAWDLLDPILLKAAAPKDPMGIIRV